jgi:beta-mannanase
MERPLPRARGPIRANAPAVVLLSAIGMLAALQFGPWLAHANPHPTPPMHAGATHASATPPPPSRVSRSATVDLGVTTGPMARNAWRVWSARDLRTVEAFERAAHKRVSVVMWYADWARNPIDLEQLREVAATGAIPEITWQPWDYSKGFYTYQPRYTLESIIDGSHDRYVRSWAHALARYGKPVRLRFGQEMNGNWYPWAEAANHNKPGQYVAAWRHLHRIFAAAGARNVQWVWSPFATSVKAEEYPGNAYVDILGLSGFNGGPDLRWSRWQPFERLFGPAMAALRAIAPHKPIELSEVAASEAGGSKAAWIAGMFASLRRDPQIVSVVWFNLDKTSSWMIQSSRAAQRAFARGVASPRYR